MKLTIGAAAPQFKTGPASELTFQEEFAALGASHFLAVKSMFELFFARDLLFHVSILRDVFVLDVVPADFFIRP